MLGKIHRCITKMELTIYIPKIIFWFLFPKYRSDWSHGLCIPINHFTDDVGIFNDSIHNAYKADEISISA